MDQQTGKYIIIIGSVIIVLGLLIYFFHNHMSWIGRLPGDIRVERENFRFYFPLTTMILLSIVVTLILYVIRKFL
ncbi:MAG: DUF2905 domain-containing protein [Flavisolibacter sp.]|jgi:H+/Cl- antiporter ClcA